MEIHETVRRGLAIALGGRQGRRAIYERKTDGELETRLVALSCSQPLPRGIKKRGSSGSRVGHFARNSYSQEHASESFESQVFLISDPVCSALDDANLALFSGL